MIRRYVQEGGHLNGYRLHRKYHVVSDGVEGPFVVGQGPVFDALPQQSTCYMVVCCDPLYPACCDTDTVVSM
ncbi:MAG: hypothetical protein IPN36_16995 [Bacteroidetes bacterium]|nr:hypothetical protein [Bacteroidota bacterium]